jgi:transcriptional regulator with XRE-family HTH domain
MRHKDGSDDATVDDPSRELGLLVARARSAKKMRQEELARAAGIGTSSLRLLESGRSNGPSVFTVLRLLKVLDVDVRALEHLGRS